jgi:predicted DNA-binding transcriptional regulator AlpA
VLQIEPQTPKKPEMQQDTQTHPRHEKVANRPFPAASEPDALVRWHQIKGFIPVSKATFLRHAEAGIFPTPVKVGRALFWRSGDIRDLAARLARGKTEQHGQ